MIIAVDFDGTLCENAWPEIGKPNIALITFLDKCRRRGDRIILWTMRDGSKLIEALDWCKDRGIVFAAVNDNLPELKAAYQNNPRKVYADWYIDDHNAEHFADFPKGLY